MEGIWAPSTIRREVPLVADSTHRRGSHQKAPFELEKEPCCHSDFTAPNRHSGGGRFTTVSSLESEPFPSPNEVTTVLSSLPARPTRSQTRHHLIVQPSDRRRRFAASPSRFASAAVRVSRSVHRRRLTCRRSLNDPVYMSRKVRKFQTDKFDT